MFNQDMEVRLGLVSATSTGGYRPARSKTKRGGARTKAFQRAAYGR